MEQALRKIRENAPMTEAELIQTELDRFIGSNERKLMLIGRSYYGDKQDILNKKRTAIGNDGEEVEVKGTPNNKIVNNIFDDLVDQKTSFLLGNPVIVKTDTDEVKEILDKRFFKTLYDIGKESYICGIAYLIPYVDGGTLRFKKVKAEQIFVFWNDEEKTEADAFAYFYDIEEYKAKVRQKVRYVEFYDKAGVRYYKYEEGKLVADPDKEARTHLSINGAGYNFNKVPLIAFKANEEAQPLIVKIKSLQDAYNQMLSGFADNMQEDMRSTILVIKNYEGTDLGEFRKNLHTYGAIKVNTVDGVNGGVDTLRIEVNAENYETILKALEDAMIKNGRGVDGKDARMKNAPNQMNIQAMYSDILLDARRMELEFQSALDEVMHFIKIFLSVKGVQVKDVTFIFDKDLPINVGEVIEQCRASVGIVSLETILEQHPFVRDTEDELKRIQAEEEAKVEAFSIPLQGAE